MEENFEQNIPIELIIFVFIFLMVSSYFLNIKLKKRALAYQGQLETDGITIPTIEQRIAVNKSWSSGKISSNENSLMIILWILSLVWILTFGVSFVKNVTNTEFPIGGKIILGVFSLLGIVPIFFAVKSTIRNFKYGKSWCCIEGKAGVLGKTLMGYIQTKNEIKPNGDYIVELQCIETYEEGTGKNRTTHTKLHLQEKQKISYTGKSSRTGIPFTFNLPKHTPETGYQLARGKINWQINISAPTDGVDYAAIFVIPVFNME